MDLGWIWDDLGWIWDDADSHKIGNPMENPMENPF
jgi:hypothetical protein